MTALGGCRLLVLAETLRHAHGRRPDGLLIGGIAQTEARGLLAEHGWIVRQRTVQESRRLAFVVAVALRFHP